MKSFLIRNHHSRFREKALLIAFIRLFNWYFEKFICILGGPLYAALFNLRLKLVNCNDTKIVSRKNFYLVIDKNFPDIKISFKNKAYATYAYKFGLKERANTLAEEYLLNKIEFNDGDVIYDCGANIGDFKLWFKYQDINIKYKGFEPSPEEFNLLSKNTFPSENQNIALWNKEDYLDFYLNSDEADSALIKPKYFKEVVKVKTKRLDHFIDEKVKLLKLEAEGTEPEVLEGIGEKLNLIEYISADLGFERGTYEESTLLPAINYLCKKNFKLIGFDHYRVIALFKNMNLKI